MGGDLADASLELGIAAAGHVLADDAAGAVPLANEALVMARRVGAPALVATGLLAVGVAMAETDPGQARACLRAKAASSAPRSATRAPSTLSGRPASRFSPATRPPPSNWAAVLSAASNGAVVSGRASSSASSRAR